MADLAIGNEWTAIGVVSSTAAADSPTPYKGVFNGNGHTLMLTHTQDASMNNIALFHTIAAEGAVKNLNLDVDFVGTSYVAGVAVRNYGTIERVTVEGKIVATNNPAGGIVACNGKDLAAADPNVPPAKILYCLNKANVSGLTIVGGIAGYFLGEMRFCGNEGTVTGSVASASNAGVGGLVALAAGGDTQKVQSFIISDCYNAGNVVSTSSFPGSGLFGNGLQVVYPWGHEYFKISDVFSYGNLYYNTSTPGGVIIGKTGAANSPFSQYQVRYQFAKTYFLDGIGTALFDVTALNGLGTDMVKEVIKSKTAKEFASAEMAALLNNGRAGADAPWEYVEGNPYPTIKATLTDSGPSYGSGGGGCDAGGAILPAMAAALALAIKRRGR
jgi:hypothetical protein